MTRRVRIPDLGTPIFKWQGEGKEGYNQWRDSLINPSRHPTYTFEDGKTIEVNKRSEPPVITDTGLLRAEVSKASKDTTGHCEWRIRHEKLHQKTYLRLGETYAWRVRMRLGTPERALQYHNTHITWIQVWGPMSTKNPTFALQVYRSQWRVQSLADGVDNSKYFGTPGNKWHNWVAIYKPSTSEGFLRVWQDHSLVCDVTGPTAYADSRGGGQQRVGCYTPPTLEPCYVDYKSIEFFAGV